MRPFYVKTVRCASGERLPTLIDGATGVPDFEATLWVVSSLRGSNFASATIEQALRSLIVLYLVLRSRNVNLTQRLRVGAYLSIEEIEAILKAAKKKTFPPEVASSSFTADATPKRTNKISSLEKVRMKMSTDSSDQDVDSNTTSIRMGYIKAFLRWRIRREILRSTGAKRKELLALGDLVDSEIKNKTPSPTSRATLHARMGIDRNTQISLLDTVMPDAPENPWAGGFISSRNQLIINSFISLGIRRSELLGLRTGDFKPQTHDLLILRRPDDISDPRLNEPNTKTRDRVLPITPDLYALVKAYLLLRHTKVNGRHDFLLVANTGAPLSKSEINRIFRALDRFPELQNITPHILRHTFFENLAEDLNSSGHSDTEILNYLRRLGGWSDTSNTPLRYIKRFVQERANKAGLAVQRKLFSREQSWSQKSSNC